MKVLNEWSISVPWGNLALISWGNPQGEPILLVHGRQDSVATFIPLLELLPNKYYYVGVDLPGHGKSNPYPVGVKLSRFHYIHVIQYAVKHLEWTRFTCVGHSMGGEIAMFYNAIYPGSIKKLVLLDVGLSLQRLQMLSIDDFFKEFFDDYYTNYNKQNFDRKVYSKEKAMEAVMKARKLSTEQAELVLSRNLVEVGNDRYILSWDTRLKLLTPCNYPKEYYYELFSKNSPPTLLLQATQKKMGFDHGRQAVNEILSKMAANCDFNILTVEGGHDVHLTNPERCAKHICEFLDKELGKSKL